MRLISLMIVVLMVTVTLTAQIDSTFVRHYYPTYSTHPYWQNYPIGRTFAANVLETYNGDFCLQILSEYHTPPPEVVTWQSPLAIFSRDGQYTETVFCPLEEYYGGFRLISGYYSTIVKDGLGGYLALDLFEHRLHRLDSNFHYVGYVPLTSNSGHWGSIRDIIKVDDGLIILGSISGTYSYAITKYNYDLAIQWECYINEMESWRTRKMTTTSDGGFLFWRGGPPSSQGNYFRPTKLSAYGDTLWTKQMITPSVQQIVEVNGNYYGFVYHSYNNTTAELRIYDFGLNFENENHGAPVLVIPTYPLLDNNMEKKNPFYVTRTSDDCIIFAISTPNAEIFKYDTDLNLLWTSNALDYERIGRGDHPLIELPNGDYVYCAGVSVYPSTQIKSVALVRINANGNYVGVEDDIETPAVSPMITAYPNPAQNSVTIELGYGELHKAPGNRIEIYNIKGQKVRSIPMNNAASPIAQIVWDRRDNEGRRCPTGVYLIRETNNPQNTKKITLVK